MKQARGKRQHMTWPYVNEMFRKHKSINTENNECLPVADGRAEIDCIWAQGYFYMWKYIKTGF